MSPILKRDIAEHVRQARRLASVTGLGYGDDHTANNETAGPSTDASFFSPPTTGEFGSSEPYASGIARNLTAGGAGSEWKRTLRSNGDASTCRGKERENIGGVDMEEENARAPRLTRQEYAEHEAGGDETARMLDGRQHARGRSDETDAGSEVTTMSSIEGKWADMRGLLFEATPSLLLSLIGLVFTGELLEHLARWRVFRRVDELFILVPMIGNLKGNLEMCLSARLGTSAAIGELDSSRTRRVLLVANMTLLGLQALLISSLAAVISFVLGLMTVHRLGDAPAAAANSTIIDPGLAVGEQEWHEGYTRPGWKQLVMVLATGMGAAGLSSLVLGSFMSSMVVLCRWVNVDPDNITPPIAACLGDLVTLFILALLGTMLVGTMDTPVPLIAVITLSLAAVWFTRRVMRDEWVKNVARGGWIPLIGAMLISSGTGMVLETGVGKYRGFALLAISMTGLTGAIGAIHANRLSTSLHRGLHPSAMPVDDARARASVYHGLTSSQSLATLFLLAFPCQACFLLFVRWAGWIDVSLGWAGWLAYAVTTAFSVLAAHNMTLLFWAHDLDPDSYTLPIHSAIVDFVGQLLLMLAYEACIWSGRTEVMDLAT